MDQGGAVRPGVGGQQVGAAGGRQAGEQPRLAAGARAHVEPRAVRPAHVVFSVGAHNAFGFPHFEVDERARSFGAATWRTDHGAVTATSDGTGIVVRQTSP